MPIIHPETGAVVPPSDITKRCKQIDERIDMVFMPHMKCWAFTERWSATDKRRSMIQRGLMDPESDFDILGWAPIGVTAEDAFAILSKGMKRRSADKDDFEYFMQRLAEFNRDASAANLQTTKDFKDEMFDANSETLGGRVVARQAGFSVEDGNLVSTPKTPKRGLNKLEKEAVYEMSDA